MYARRFISRFVPGKLLTSPSQEIPLAKAVWNRLNEFYIAGANGLSRVLEIEEAKLLNDSFWLSFFDGDTFRSEIFPADSLVHIPAEQPILRRPRGVNLSPPVVRRPRGAAPTPAPAPVLLKRKPRS